MKGKGYSVGEKMQFARDIIMRDQQDSEGADYRVQLCKLETLLCLFTISERLIHSEFR